MGLKENLRNFSEHCSFTDLMFKRNKKIEALRSLQ